MSGSTQQPNIRPLGDRVLVQRAKVSEESRGGIIIPDSAREKPQEAEVIAIGNGKLNKDGSRRPFEVKPGDRILLARYGGTEVKRGDESYLLIPEDDILAILG